MGWFDEQIRQRAKSDQDVLEDSFYRMADAVLGSWSAGRAEDERLIAREALDSITTELEAMRAELRPMVEALESPLQKSAMRMRYIEGHSVREIAYSLNYSEQHIFRILTIAERSIQKR